MKRRDLVNHLMASDCRLYREGSRHSIYINPVNDRISAVPRHREIKESLVKKICRDLEIAQP